MTQAQSPQLDRFVHDRLPDKHDLPEFLALPSDNGPLNCVSFLLDRHLHGPSAHRHAIKSGARHWTYQQLGQYVGRIANVLVQDYGVRPGNRVLLRGVNSPEIAALWLAIQKIGAVGVVTMSLLRAGELATILDLAKPVLAISDAAIATDLETALAGSGGTCQLLTFTDEGGALFAKMATRSADCETCPTLGDDISILAFTSGTTGAPKATVHFHRDISAICETVGAHVIRATADDVFIGTAPLAFTFGLGGLLILPLHAGACTVLNPPGTARDFASAIRDTDASICFTVPTFYQRMLREGETDSLKNLRLAISSGESLPHSVRTLWTKRTGVELAEVLGATEMLHAYAGASGSAIPPGYIGPAIPGYKVAILDSAGRALPPGTPGRLAVKGPTGCRYLNDPRQGEYVQNGWNLTGDMCKTDSSGHIAYLCRADDMIISAGYNISAPEVENALLSHPDVTECAVIGEADEARGQIVAAFVVCAATVADPGVMADRLQNHVRQKIAAYKYPRKVVFVATLPRSESGKLQRYRLNSSG